MKSHLKRSLILGGAVLAWGVGFPASTYAECCDVPVPIAPINEGDKAGGGGEPKEIDVDNIRADIDQWIRAGGARDLRLSRGLSYAEYEAKMLAVLAPHAVVIGFIDEDDANNLDLSVRVDGQPKTCRGFIVQRDATAHMLCHRGRYKSATESERYQLIHHEYAGLAGIERNLGASSDYSISKQISDYLVPITVLRLAVKHVVKPTRVDTGCRIAIESMLVEYDAKKLNSAAGVRRLTEELSEVLVKKGYAVVSRRKADILIKAVHAGWAHSEQTMAFLQMIHPSTGFQASDLTAIGRTATPDPLRVDLIHERAAAKTVAEFQAVQAKIASTVFRDGPPISAIQNVAIPSCEEFYGKRALTLPANETRK